MIDLADIERQCLWPSPDDTPCGNCYPCVTVAHIKALEAERDALQAKLDAIDVLPDESQSAWPERREGYRQAMRQVKNILHRPEASHD